MSVSTRHHVRWMLRKDMPLVLKMENELSFNAWTEEDFLKILRNNSVIAMVSSHETNNSIDGYMIYEIHEKKLNIIKFVTADKKCGKSMLARLKAKLSFYKLPAMTHCLNERNTFMQSVFKKEGFSSSVLKRNYFYPDDGIHFIYSS